MSEEGGTGATEGGTGATEGGTGATEGHAPSWTDGLSDEQKGFVDLKGFKGAGAAVDAYKNLEKLLGAPRDRLVVWPEEGKDLGKIYSRLGRPESADKYELELGEDHDEKSVAFLREAAFEAGLSNKAAATLFEKMGAYAKEQGDLSAKSQEAQMKQDMQREIEGLKKEWGGEADGRMALAAETATRLGMDKETVDALGDAMGVSKATKLLYSLGVKTGEASFHDGEGGGPLSPRGAKAKLAMLKQDQGFAKRFASGDATAIQEFNDLHKKAFSA